MMARRAVYFGLWASLCVVLATAFLGLLPSRAEAHPLGNFTINHYSRIEFSGETARVDYVLDFAEIPTLQQKEHLDLDNDGMLSDEEAGAYLDDELPSLLKGLRLEVGGEDLPLRVGDRSAEFVPGQGGLPTLRIEARLLADLPRDWKEHGAGYYTDRNYQDRLGWREILVQGGAGIAVEDSTAPTDDVSDELRSYPRDSLSSPLDVREARFTLVPGGGTVADGAADRVAGSAFAGDNGGVTERLVSLVSADRLSGSIILFSVLAAFLWGAAHALTPGHGKAVVAAYLVGTRGTVRHAGFLGLTVTLTHTAGVFVLGVVTIYLSRYILPETLYPWLNVVSGLLVVAIGLSLFYQRLRGARKGYAHTHHAHHDHRHEDSHGIHGIHSHSSGEHHHAHSHGGHAHEHLPPGADGPRVGWRGLLALGISGGLVPCPAALVLLLGAISLGRVGFGIALVVAFSVGLAIVLAGIGILMVYARRLFERYSFEARTPSFLPVASALLISVVGLMIVLGSLGRAGIV